MQITGMKNLKKSTSYIPGILATIGVSSAMLLSSVCTTAVNLPTRIVNGRECYYHEVKPKETIYGLCKEFGITKSQLVQYNPSVADGLRSGAILYFPVDDFPELGVADDNNADNYEASKPKVYISPADTVRTYRKAAVHHVKKGETVYGICKRYGISETELFQLNPSLRDGLKHGTLIMLPDSCQQPEADIAVVKPEVPKESELPHIASDTKEEMTVPAMPSPAETTSPITDNNNGESVTSDESDDPVDPTPADINQEPSAVADDGTTNIAVILPFMLADANADKQTQLYTEFYKGLLLAADSLRRTDRPTVIRAYDSAASLDTVVNLLNRPELENVDVIITPDDDDQLDAIARFARERNAVVFNIFAVKNEKYLSNPDILQANITHSAVYPKAISEFIRIYPQYTPVFLTSREGKTDKKDFTAKLREELSMRGREYVEIPYNGYLKESDLSALNTDGWYVFVPESGTSTEFNHIAGALKTFRESHADYNQVRLFGYPEWITFRGNALENLHFLDATVYSRFYNDDNSYRSKDIAERYKKWYGAPMISAVPVQGILGFDAGYYLLKSVNDNNGDLIGSKYLYDGVQSGFHFSNAGNSAGKVNDTLYFIEFRPSGLIDKHSVE